MEQSHFDTIKYTTTSRILLQSYSDKEEKVKKELNALKKKARRDVWFLGKR